MVVKLADLDPDLLVAASESTRPDPAMETQDDGPTL
jgi:hypothetical protein